MQKSLVVLANQFVKNADIINDFSGLKIIYSSLLLTLTLGDKNSHGR